MTWTKNSKRWNSKRYPANWNELSFACKERAAWKCEICGIKNGETLISKAGNEYKVRLAACHIHPNDEQNPNPDLICLCVRHHALFDTLYKSAMATGGVETLKHRLATVSRLQALRGQAMPTCREIDLSTSINQLVLA